jgi:transposase
MPLTELVHHVTVTFKMTKQADQLHHDNAPAHSTALIQAFLAKHHITKVCQAPYTPDLAPCNSWLFPKAKITIAKEICECNSHTVHKLSQCYLTAN